MPLTLPSVGTLQPSAHVIQDINGVAIIFPTTFKPVALAAGTAETTIWTPAASKKFRLLRLFLTASAQTILTFKDNTAGTTILVVELAANVPTNVELGGPGIPSATANNVLTVTRGTSAALNGFAAGTEE